MVLVVKMGRSKELMIMMDRSVGQDKELAVLVQMMVALKKHQSALSGDIVNAPPINLEIRSVDQVLILLQQTIKLWECKQLGIKYVEKVKELAVLDQMMAVLLKPLYVQNGDIVNVRPISLGDLSVALDLMTLKQTVRMLSVEKEKVLAALDQMMAVLQRLLSVLNGDIANVLLINPGIQSVDLDFMRKERPPEKVRQKEQSKAGIRAKVMQEGHGKGDKAKQVGQRRRQDKGGMVWKTGHGSKERQNRQGKVGREK